MAGVRNCNVAADALRAVALPHIPLRFEPRVSGRAARFATTEEVVVGARQVLHRTLQSRRIGFLEPWEFSLPAGQHLAEPPPCRRLARLLAGVLARLKALVVDPPHSSERALYLRALGSAGVDPDLVCHRDAQARPSSGFRCTASRWKAARHRRWRRNSCSSKARVCGA